MKSRYLVISVVVLLAAFFASVVSATDVDPVQVDGNPECSDFGDWIELKVDPTADGVYTDGFLTVEITVDGKSFKWTSNLGVDAVVSKGGPNGANVYYYDPESFGDTGLMSPDNKKGEPGGLSHVSFCYDFELEVEKTAETGFTRTFEWDIVKSVDPAVWELFVGDSGTSEYTVEVFQTGYTDSDWFVTGVITISNPAPFDATVESVSDAVSGIGAVAVDCGATFPYALPAGGDLICSYNSGLPDGSSRVNTATVETSGPVDGGSDDADVVFGEPTTLVNDTVNVDDTYAGDLGSFSGSGSVSYEREFTCGQDEGQHDNVATIVETGQSDDASVQVNCSELEVSKGATTTYTRTFEWDIVKSVDPSEHHLFVGDYADSTYTVEVIQTGYVDSDWAVTGNIRIDNPNPVRNASLTAVIDTVSPDIAASVNCPSYVVPAGGYIECSYSSPLPDAASRVNTATATLQNVAIDQNGGVLDTGTTDFSGSAEVTFGEPTTLVNDTVNVDDTYAGDLGSFSDTGSTSYTRTFTCGQDEGQHDNVATIVETGQSDDASVQVKCSELTITKNANTSYDRTHFWDVLKEANSTGGTIGYNESLTVDYVITAVYNGSVNSNFAIEGTIWVVNNHPFEVASLASVTDNLGPVTCPALEVPAGGTLTCTYEAVGDGNDTTNTATANQNTDSGIVSYFGSAPVTYGNAAVNDIDECITVSDPMFGLNAEVCANQGTVVFSGPEYSKTFGPYGDDCGIHEIVNTATIVTNDTGSYDDASWTIVIDAECAPPEWCSPGYWKNHDWPGGEAQYNDPYSVVYPFVPDAPYIEENPTLRQVIDDNNVWGGQAFNAVGTYLSISAGLNVQFNPDGSVMDHEDGAICPLN